MVSDILDHPVVFEFSITKHVIAKGKSAFLWVFVLYVPVLIKIKPGDPHFCSVQRNHVEISFQ